jgi:hypothetical protein
MPPQGVEFTKGPFQNVPYLIEQTDLLYSQQIVPKGGPTKFRAAADRCIDHRGWRPTLPLFEKHLEPVLEELGIFYVPKQLSPGPGFVFPKFDATRAPVGGKFNPLGWELLINNTPAKYAILGLGFEFRGPSWIGNSDRVLKSLIEKRTVYLVEGPWDLVACRVLAPDVPVLTSETKTLNEMHWAYLKILGVKQVHFLFDNEFSTKREGAAGAGALASSGMSEKAKEYGFKTSTLRCARHDPSECLKYRDAAIALKNSLRLSDGIIN